MLVNTSSTAQKLICDAVSQADPCPANSELNISYKVHEVMARSRTYEALVRGVGGLICGVQYRLGGHIC